MLYRCFDTKAGQTVAMATLSIALAAECFFLFFFSQCVCVSVSVPVCNPMGVSSMSTVKAVNKPGRSDRELGGD